MRRCESNASSAVQSEEEQGSRSSPVMTGIFTFIHLYAKHWSIEACRSRFDSSYSRYHCCYVCHEGHIWWARLWLLDESTNIVIIKCVKCCFVLYCWIRTTRFFKTFVGASDMPAAINIYLQFSYEGTLGYRVSQLFRNIRWHEELGMT